ncbi:unnamed protein product [Zymoseptoria tritici ST99CH_3D1]|uniref:Uncharacterized protein n=1 Tax=Zymoseptoria tritici ST99CH_1E4 TaxID=1276532 RepID=A0A2H1GB39_ZYMTR|nr:unnamed protein product [Zymoseptoria tritici ST99CH_1E4]SMR51704.1 unnamed protein product [Zymoseptoria tritici ST99CH_3D1]
MASYLAFWYRTRGRVDEAQQLVRPNVKDSVLLFSDDDPTNDQSAIFDSSRVFLALGNTDRFLATMYALREYLHGTAILEGDRKIKTAYVSSKLTQQDEDGAEIIPFADPREDDIDEELAGGCCDGPCGEALSRWDGMMCCLICGDFCERRGCREALLAFEIAVKSCNTSHEAMIVSVLKTRFEKGETLLGDKVITLEEWKAGLKKERGL